MRSGALTPLGFGVSGAHGTPLVSRQYTQALIRAAFQAGVRVFDTAPAYGAGEAERRLGAALRGLKRETVFVSTKAGVTSAGLARRRRDFSPDAIERSVQDSLVRLGVEGVDALFLHGAAAEELNAALLARLQALKSAGAFALLGAAGRGAELDAAIETGCFDALMAPVHPFVTPREEARLTRANEAGLVLFAIETAGPGRAPLAVPRRPADVYRLAQRFRRSADGPRLTVSDGLQAALRRPVVDCALFTTTRLDHLKMNAVLAG